MNKKATLTLLAIASVSALAIAGGLQKHPTSGSLKGAKSKGMAPGKLGNANADRNPKALRPVKKGGAKAKGSLGEAVLHVDNRTDYIIDVYVDGGYMGRIGAYGDTYDAILSGSHSFFARSAGGTTTWGPTTFYAPSGSTFTESLN